MKLAKHQNRGHYKSCVPQLLPTPGLRLELKQQDAPLLAVVETSQVWEFQFGAATQSKVIGLFNHFSKALLSTYLLGAGALEAYER